MTDPTRSLASSQLVNWQLLSWEALSTSLLAMEVRFCVFHFPSGTAIQLAGNVAAPKAFIFFLRSAGAKRPHKVVYIWRTNA